MGIDHRDNLQIILDELDSLSGPKKPASGSIMICCPFHGDTAPSLGISIDVNSKIPVGYYNCFGCPAKGHWNTLADKLGLAHIKSWNKSTGHTTQVVTPDLDDELLGDAGLTLSSLFSKMGCPEAMPWVESLEWRGFPGSLIKAVGGHITNDDRNDSIAVLFPIHMAGRLRGGVKAIYQRKSKSVSAYYTMKGSWVVRYGLFPFSYTKRLLEVRKFNFVVLVEGPRDALRLLLNGIPALAILGSKNMSKSKAMFLESLGVDTYYALTDCDKGGDTMWERCKQYLKDTGKLRRMKLPEDKVNGEAMDPGNAPVSVMKRIIKILKTRHGFYNKHDQVY